MTDYSVDTPEGRHVVRVDGGFIILPDHRDIRSDLALVTLGGLPCPCVTFALVLEWLSHAHLMGASFLSGQPEAVRTRIVGKAMEIAPITIWEVYVHQWNETGERLLVIEEGQWRSR